MTGNNKNHIFERDGAKTYFLNALKHIEDDGLIRVVAWCIMDNHVHLVINSEPDDLSIAFKRINIKYAMNNHRKTNHIDGSHQRN